MQRNASMAVRRDVRKVRTEILSEGLCTERKYFIASFASKSGLVVVCGRKVRRPYLNGSLRKLVVFSIQLVVFTRVTKNNLKKTRAIVVEVY